MQNSTKNIKREDWEEYADIDTNGNFSILEDRLEKEAKERNVQEYPELLDDDLREQQNIHWYWNNSLLEEN